MRPVLLALALTSFLVACGSRPAQPRSEATAAAVAGVCEKACALRARCGQAADEAACKASCVANPALRKADMVRPEVLDAAGSCIEATSCADATDGPAVGRRCVMEAARDVAPSKKVVRACAAFDELVARCGGKMPAACVDRFKAVSDNLVDEAIECTNASCRTARVCLNQLASALKE
jgi:hypothetical protein